MKMMKVIMMMRVRTVKNTRTLTLSHKTIHKLPLRKAKLPKLLHPSKSRNQKYRPASNRFKRQKLPRNNKRRYKGKSNRH